MTAVVDTTPLIDFLRRVPAVGSKVASGTHAGMWWVKFSIDTEHGLAWHVVQEFGQVLNYLSGNERLPTIFKPVSPPSYLNGGPKEFLSWVIESTSEQFSPAECSEWLTGRLPSPVEDLSEWEQSEE